MKILLLVVFILLLRKVLHKKPVKPVIQQVLIHEPVIEPNYKGLDKLSIYLASRNVTSEENGSSARDIEDLQILRKYVDSLDKRYVDSLREVG